MDHATSIVPPKPRVTERRVVGRPKMRRALQMCSGAAALALGAACLLLADSSSAPLIVLVGVAFASGVSAIFLRFVEQPREIVVRKVDHEWNRSVIH
jgi:hypothetical protein